MGHWEEEIVGEEEEEEEEGCNQMSGLHHSCRLLDFDTKSAVCKCCANSHLIESTMALKWTFCSLPVCPLGVQNPLKSILCILAKGNLPSNVTGKANFYSRAL